MTQTIEKQQIDEFELMIENSMSKKIETADVITGVIIKRENDGFLIDIGHKTEAFLPDKEITNLEAKDVNEIVKVGEKYDLFVVNDTDNSENQIIVSLKRVAFAQVWSVLAEAKQNNDSIITKVMSQVRGGIIVDVMELKGFIPSSHLRMSPPFDNLIGQELEVKIIEADAKKNKLILSQRLALVEKRSFLVDEILSTLKIDEIVTGEVIRIADFGAFIDVKGVDGLLPISEISWDRIKHPSDVLKAGEKIDVKVLKIDYDSKRISLTLKRMTPNPWDEIKELFHEGQIIEGVVNKITSFGAFVNIYKNVEALLPISEMVNCDSVDNINPSNIYKTNDVIKAVIKKFSPDEHRIALSVKDLHN